MQVRSTAPQEYENTTHARKGISATEIRKALRQRGYLPIPVAYRDKACLMKGWQRYVHDPENPCPASFFGVAHPATGVRCDGILAFDIDCPDETTRDDVRAIIEKVCGDTPAVRFRDRSRKVAMFYRPEPHFAVSEGTRFRLSGQQKLEVYGAGDVQIIVHGEHAESTDEHPIYYRWEEQPLWEIDRTDLPPVDHLGVREAVRRAVEMYPPIDGADASLRGDAEPPQACVRNIMTSDDYHGSTVALAGHFAATGMQPELILEYIDWVYSAVPPLARDPRWQERWRDIERCVWDVYRRELRKADSAYVDHLERISQTRRRRRRDRS